MTGGLEARAAMAAAAGSAPAVTAASAISNFTSDVYNYAMRLLLVEDDELLGDALRVTLGQEGYDVVWVTDGIAAERALLGGGVEAVVLDLGLPYKDGLEVLRALRARGGAIPVLVLTARDAVAERVEGLDTGADDYLVKPFDMDELLARLRALLRRAGGRVTPVLRHGDILLDPTAHTVALNDRPVELTRSEFVILKTLLENAGKVVSRPRLEAELYGPVPDVDSNAVEVYVHHLRKKFGNELIRTLRGVGYLIAKPKP